MPYSILIVFSTTTLRSENTKAYHAIHSKKNDRIIICRNEINPVTDKLNINPKKHFVLKRLIISVKFCPLRTHFSQLKFIYDTQG